MDQIILATENPDELYQLNEAFRIGGYDVVAIDSLSQLQGAVSMGVAQVLVLSASLGPDRDVVQLCQSLRKDQKTQQLPVMVICSGASTFHPGEFIWMGIDDFAVRPVSPRTMVTRVRLMSQFLDHERALMYRKERQELKRKETPTEIDSEMMQEQILRKVYAALHYEIRNPLASLLIGSALLSQYFDTTKPEYRIIDEISVCTKRIRDVLSSLAAVKKIVFNDYILGTSMVDLDQSLRQSYGQ